MQRGCGVARHMPSGQHVMQQACLSCSLLTGQQAQSCMSCLQHLGRTARTHGSRRVSQRSLLQVYRSKTEDPLLGRLTLESRSKSSECSKHAITEPKVLGTTTHNSNNSNNSINNSNNSSISNSINNSNKSSNNINW